MHVYNISLWGEKRVYIEGIDFNVWMLSMVSISQMRQDVLNIK